MSETVKVLDTTYKMEEIKEQDKFMIENNLYGYCDFYEKKIVVLASDNVSEQELRETKQHELTRALLYECGYSDWARNEEITGWFAKEFPKFINTLLDYVRLILNM